MDYTEIERLAEAGASKTRLDAAFRAAYLRMKASRRRPDKPIVGTVWQPASRPQTSRKIKE